MCSLEDSIGNGLYPEEIINFLDGVELPKIPGSVLESYCFECFSEIRGEERRFGFFQCFMPERAKTLLQNKID